MYIDYFTDNKKTKFYNMDMIILRKTLTTLSIDPVLINYGITSTNELQVFDVLK